MLLPGREMASMPFVAYGILNYLRMVYVEGAGGVAGRGRLPLRVNANLRRGLDCGGYMEPGIVVR